MHQYQQCLLLLTGAADALVTLHPEEYWDARILWALPSAHRRGRGAATQVMLGNQQKAFVMVNPDILHTDSS